MLDGVDVRRRRDRRALSLRVRGDALTAVVYRLHRGRELVGREGDLVAGPAGVHGDLHEIRARVHLGERGRPQLAARVDEDHEGRELVAPRQPRPCGHDPRSVEAAARLVSHAKVETARSAHVACRENTHAREVPRGVVATREQLRVRVAEARDPVRAAEAGEVRVAIDEAGHDGRSGGVDHSGVTRVRSAVVGTEVGDTPTAHQQGGAAAERR